MPDPSADEYWVDWYLRDELSAEDEAAFETAVLESPELQNELEASLALRAALARDARDARRADRIEPARAPRSEWGGWKALPLAASVTLAVLSTVMWWKADNEAVGLERQLEVLAQPASRVLTVDVPIMRSFSAETPDVIIQKPEGRAAILLNIELGLQSRELALLNFALVDPAGKTVVAWQSAPGREGRATAIIENRQIPASRLWLQISSGEHELLERRLLEFRAAD